MIKQNIKKQVEEAIASQNTTESNRKLFIEILEELNSARNEKEYIDIALRLIEFFNICATTGGFG